MKRITVIAGHYGSGKTEFSVNLAMNVKNQIESEGRHQKVALLDMDIANPYFRSRERQQLLEDAGISVYYNTFGYDITEDLPAISAAMRGPMEDENCLTIVDVGGNDSGARVLKQFEKYFKGPATRLLCVLNANRPETDSVDGMIEHLQSIETETGLKFHGIINNTHLLMDTSPEDILNGYELCSQVSQRLDIPVVWSTCNEKLLDDLKKLMADKGIESIGDVYPIELYMRPSWLDR